MEGMEHFLIGAETWLERARRRQYHQSMLASHETHVSLFRHVPSGLLSHAYGIVAAPSIRMNSERIVSGQITLSSPLLALGEILHRDQM